MSELIDAHLRHIRAAGLAPATTIYRRGKLLRRLDDLLPMGLDHSTTEELEDFLADPDFSIQTQATYHMHLTNYFAWACDPGRGALHLSYNPAAGLRRPKVPEGVPNPVTNAELAHALASLREPWRTYALLAAYEGARAAEVAALDRADVNNERTRIRGKGRRVRVLKTHGAVWAAIEDLPAGRIARSLRDGKEVSAGYISSRMFERFKEIDLPDVTIHRLRHWYGTMMLRPVKYGGAGASLRTVQMNMGHASLATTARYTLVCDEERAEAIDSLPTFTAPDPS